MIEETKKRLQNIKAIEPYVNAMRTSSLGLWKAAINRMNSLLAFRGEIAAIEGMLAPKNEDNKRPIETLKQVNNTYIVFGSQKGLVSNFNRNLLPLIGEAARSNPTAQFTILTNRSNAFQSFMDSRDILFSILPFKTDLGYQDSVALYNQLGLHDLPVNSIYYIYNSYQRGQGFAPTKQSAALLQNTVSQEKTPKTWPPFILDSTLEDLHQFIDDLLRKAAFHYVLANSVASENVFRNRILEEAKNNTERLIEELSIELATARKKEITKEIQELAVAAGLID